MNPDQYHHQVFLKTTLWKFASQNQMTDIQFICEEGEIVGGHQSVLSLCQPQMFAKLLSLLPSSGLSSLEMVTIFLPDWQHIFVSQAIKKLYIENDPVEIMTILGFRKNNCTVPVEESQKLIDQNFIIDTLSRKKEIKESVSSKGKIACDICGQFVSKLKEHLLRKHPENLDSLEATLFECEMCNYSTRIKSTLKQHIYNVHTEKTLKCDQCNYKTALQTRLKQHTKKVHGSPTVFCSFDGCQRKFVQKCDLTEHIKRTHPTGIFNCHICGKPFVNEEKLKRHLRMHNIDNEGLPCQHCHLKFLTKQKLKEHINTHTGETPYKCPGISCDQAFMSSSSLAHHKKVCVSLLQ